MRLVSIEMLNDKMILAKNLYAGNCLVVTAGASNLTKYIENMKNMGIRYAYVEDETSRDIDIPDAISEETRCTAKNVLMHTLQDYQKSSTLHLVRLSDSVEDIIGDIIRHTDIQVSLSDISAVDEYTFNHSVSTTVYALLIGRSLNYSKKKLEWLAMGTLLHDVGKIILDPQIVYKKSELTESEYEYVKRHTTCGYELLKNSSNVPFMSKEIALNHHEKLDGTGYPRGLSGSELNAFCRITAIADVYDALTSDRCYRKKWSTNKAADFLIQNSGAQFDANLVRLFIQQIAIYPNGSMVRLSDGKLAIVTEQNKRVPLRPNIRVIADADGTALVPYDLDLMEVLSITIIESEIEIEKSFLESKNYKMESESDRL